MQSGVNIVVITGSGISAESGIRTFRDSGGLWEEYAIEDVATPEAWKRNPGLVLRFYNQRRWQLDQVEPNAAHLALVKLSKHFMLTIITQNVDDLHERAGSERVLHLHGELRKARGEHYPDKVYTIGSKEIALGDLCEGGSQLRPHIVWFGEEVPLITDAMALVQEASHLLVIGTSLNVYPAAGLVHHAPYGCEKILIDPDTFPGNMPHHCRHVQENAGIGVPLVVDELIERLG
ncbi:MAG: NAD-dependent deacylase [Bacteroidia bacterium]|nr:NAD-dependent deacylase [Bacteroidia bacterium]